VKVRHHQYVDILILTLLIIPCVQSYIRGTRGLDLLSMVSMWFMSATIVIGLLVAAYIRITKSQIFDPLSSELDEDPEDVEENGIRPF